TCRLEDGDHKACITTIDGVSLSNRQGLPAVLGNGDFDQLVAGRSIGTLRMLADDQFPHWPSRDEATIAGWTGKPLLVARARPNLRAAWTAIASGALQASLDGSTICSITMQEETTDVAVCCKGEIIDTASMSIGPYCLRFDSDLQITEISD